VVYRKGDGFDSKTLNEVMVPLFKTMADYFDNLYIKQPRDVRSNFDEWNRISRRFDAAVRDGRCGHFFSHRGTLGTYLRMPVEPAPKGAYDPLIEAICLALNPGSRS
jgi:hypothetical protein